MHSEVQLIIFDEYVGELGLTTINSIADSMYSFNFKGGSFDMELT